jgi:general secretion pathway protein G
MNIRTPLSLAVVVLAVLASGFISYLAGGPIRCDGCSKNHISRIQIEELIATLSDFASDTGRYPTTAEGLDALVNNPRNLKGWNGPYLKKNAPNDPWGNAYGYRCPGIRNPDYYDLRSNGEDGIEGTEDDITNWK